MSKIFFVFVFAFILLATLCVAEEYKKESSISSAAEKTVAPKINCGTACSARCRLSSRPRLCNRACGTCCARCSCVPPGTSGNENVCPCYANMTTHGGRHKCP